MKNLLIVALGFAFMTSAWAKGVEIVPDVSPRGTLQFGFRCQYDNNDNLNILWMVKTSQKLARIPTSLWWSAYDTRTQRYYLPWSHTEFSGGVSSPLTLTIESHDINVARPILRNLLTTEIHFSNDGSGDSRSVAYVFPLGRYRVQDGAYFYDLTYPIQHCRVNEFDLPWFNGQ